jgi:DNA repair photolyase
MSRFNGKAIYQPKGKAAEYSEWACNFYVGCSNGCEYCYCKKGILSGTMGGENPTLKKCFKDEEHALEIFNRELKANLDDLRVNGLFFSFTTDPMLVETIKLTALATKECIKLNIPVKILTKSVKFIHYENWFFDYLPPISSHIQSLIAFGFTLTGHDELEKGASTNAERIEAMRKLHEAGFKNFASIEPIINFADSLSMIEQAAPYCNLFKIGLKSGEKHHFELIRAFMEEVLEIIPATNIYFKDTLLNQAGVARDSFSLPENCVDKYFNMFN